MTTNDEIRKALSDLRLAVIAVDSSLREGRAVEQKLNLHANLLAKPKWLTDEADDWRQRHFETAQRFDAALRSALDTGCSLKTLRKIVGDRDAGAGPLYFAEQQAEFERDYRPAKYQY